jgi:hypothetical protein
MDWQAANNARPTAEPSAFVGTASLKIQRFRNWKIMAIELAVAVFALCVFGVTTVGSPTTPGIICIIAGIGALGLFRRELSGILIDSKTLSMPTRRIRWMPFLSFRRRKVLLSEVRRLTRLARWFGFDVVKINGAFGWELLIFASPGQRRRFTMLIQSICPGVAVYQIRSKLDQSAPLRPYAWLGNPTVLGLIPDRQAEFRPFTPESGPNRGMGHAKTASIWGPAGD